jgi:hypothetical protein
MNNTILTHFLNKLSTSICSLIHSKLLQTFSKLIGQNLMPIEHSLAEIMRDMTPQTTDTTNT